MAENQIYQYRTQVITFDISCLHELTEIGINFLKAGERTTIFSLEIAKEEAGPFTTIIEEAISAESGVAVDSEQFFSLDGVIGRYLRFTDIGNSFSTNWTNTANVTIYGKVHCENMLNDDDILPLEEEIKIYPVPVEKDLLTVHSRVSSLRAINIYNVNAEKVLTTNGNMEKTISIDIAHLSSGIYIIHIENIAQYKFIVI